MTNGGDSFAPTGGCRSWNASETGPDSVEAYRTCQHPSLERAFLKKRGVTLMVGRCVAGGRKLWLGAPEQPYRAVSARGIETFQRRGFDKESSRIIISPNRNFCLLKLEPPDPPPPSNGRKYSIEISRIKYRS